LKEFRERSFHAAAKIQRKDEAHRPGRKFRDITQVVLQSTFNRPVRNRSESFRRSDPLEIEPLTELVHSMRAFLKPVLKELILKSQIVSTSLGTFVSDFSHPLSPSRSANSSDDGCVVAST
jgi:hypothetical protein